MDLKYKAEIAYCTGDTIVKKEDLEEVMKELEGYPGSYYGDFEMNGLVLIQKA